ncbi:MAG: DUF929 domain-containing protein [Candidatus Thermoplasmatota archaeon]|nr:DUF929 domain-containing protein [Candidatus Thermoplasmatota archaeon]
MSLVVYISLFQTNEPGESNQYEKSIGDFNLVSSSPTIYNGKIVVLFIGSEACPFCAAESWSLVSALQQYGPLTGLTQIISNSSESIPNVPGYGLANASYHSNDISFWEVETTTTSWNHKLQSPNSTEQSLFKHYDPNGNIPFLLIGGLYLHVGSAVSPELMANMGWTQCQNEISAPGMLHNQIQDEVGNITNVIDYLESNKSLPGGMEISTPLHTSTTTAIPLRTHANLPCDSTPVRLSIGNARTTFVEHPEGLPVFTLLSGGLLVDRYGLTANIRKVLLIL